MNRGAEDKFARVAALKPARHREPIEERPHSAGAAEFDPLAQFVGATVGRNRYGEHLVVRRWYSTPASISTPLRCSTGRRPPSSAAPKA